MNQYLIAIGRTPSGYSAHCPDVPGRAAVGVTVEETVANMKEALEFHFEGMIEDGEPLPQSDGVSAYQEIAREIDSGQYLLAHVHIDTDRLSLDALTASV